MSGPLAIRALGVMLAALLVAGQLAVLGHRGLVQHAVCAEHGELVHADESELNLRARQETARVAVTPDSAPIAHDHCECLGRVPELFVVPNARVALAIAAPPACSNELRFNHDAPVATDTPLAVAPKQSPPTG